MHLYSHPSSTSLRYRISNLVNCHQVSYLWVIQASKTTEVSCVARLQFTHDSVSLFGQRKHAVQNHQRMLDSVSLLIVEQWSSVRVALGLLSLLILWDRRFPNSRLELLTKGTLLFWPGTDITLALTMAEAENPRSDLTHCPVCFEAYTESGEHIPRILPCFCTMCHVCIGQLMQPVRSQDFLSAMAEWGGSGDLAHCPVCFEAYTDAGEHQRFLPGHSLSIGKLGQNNQKCFFIPPLECAVLCVWESDGMEFLCTTSALHRIYEPNAQHSFLVTHHDLPCFLFRMEHCSAHKIAAPTEFKTQRAFQRTSTL